MTPEPHDLQASHAKGLCATGDFEPSRAARGLTRSELYRESKVAATLRFSIGGGNPRVSDESRTVRGLSVHLQGEHERHDLVLVSHPAPASYATTVYHSTQAFAFKTAAMTTRARIVAVPAAGTHHLTADEEATLPDLFLEAEATSRLARGTIDFTLYAQPAAADDSLIDPSQPWSAQGPAPIELGRLRVRRLAEASAFDASTFVPTVLPEGIEAGDDPILRARAAACGPAPDQRLRR